MDQLVEIIKVLGTPSREEIHNMNPNYTEFKFPQIKAHPWAKVFSKRMPPDAITLVGFTYSVWLCCQPKLEEQGLGILGGRGALMMDLKSISHADDWWRCW